jgi:cytidylate kinase
MAVITISREPGAFGEEIAARLAGKLGFMLVDKTRLVEFWSEVDPDTVSFKNVDEWIPMDDLDIDSETEATVRLLPELIVQLAEEHDLVVIGRGAQGLFRNCPGTLHVKIVASRQFRVRNIQSSEEMSSREARRWTRDLENQRARYLRFLYDLNWADPNLYDLTLQMNRLSIDQALNLICCAVDEMQIQQIHRNQIIENIISETDEDRENDHFVHFSEEEFARFLEFYGIPFAYEPDSFPLETNEEGKVIEAFTPDFYLPEQDLYIELTTMKQSLVTRKNRKVRKLRKLYPEINIRIFYQRDFYRLMAKYGLLAPESETTDNEPKKEEP